MYNDYKNIHNLFFRNENSIIVSLGNSDTYFDVSFSLVTKVNNIKNLYQSGIATQTKSLVVAINKLSSFCFSLDAKAPTSSVYVSEKLGIRKDCSEIAEQITYIINKTKENV
jgi:hypothetical protein